MSELSAAEVVDFSLDRRNALPAIIGRHEDFLIVSSLGGPSRDLTALTDSADHLFALGGVMGASSTVGLGLALAQPDQRVLVVAGDGDLMMSSGALATIAQTAPPNLSILCVNNGRFGETGNQVSHSASTVDLELLAQASGFRNTLTVRTTDDQVAGHDLLRTQGPVFVVVRVSDGEPAQGRINWDPLVPRLRFLMGMARRAERTSKRAG